MPEGLSPANASPHRLPPVSTARGWLWSSPAGAPGGLVGVAPAHYNGGTVASLRIPAGILNPCGGRCLVEKIEYVRLYAGPDGESHFVDAEIELRLGAVAPPAPPVWLSAFLPAERVAFGGVSPDWYGDWHPAPRRQFLVYIAGGGGGRGERWRGPAPWAGKHRPRRGHHGQGPPQPRGERDRGHQCGCATARLSVMLSG